MVKESFTPLYPGATLGVMGGGQLGRMFAVDALRMGYRVWVFDPDPASPAGAIATEHLQAPYDDEQALDRMADACDAITIEFENIPVESLRYLAAKTRVAPAADCVVIAQDRRLEKQFVIDAGLQCAPFGIIESTADIPAAAKAIEFPAILKTARLGYDGKGQFVCHSVEDVENGFEQAGQVPCVLEQRIDLKTEVSVVLARSSDGKITPFPVAENTHSNGILATTLVPTSVSETIEHRAIEMASEVASAMSYVGVLAVELFVDGNNNLLVNEMAPRPHNSGHYTLDGTLTSQFEQQVRMLCGLEAGDPSLITASGMLNLLGDRWSPEPHWSTLDAHPTAKLHLYGKAEARPGRKMGHINVTAADRLSVEHLLSKLNTQV